MAGAAADYQRRGIEFLRNKRRALLADAPGLGKTMQALLAAEPPVLWVGPKSTIKHIESEIKRWRPDLEVQLTWYEHFRAHHQKLVSEKQWQTLVLDEAHRVKTYTTQQSAAARYAARRIPRLYMLTGTPIINRPTELWHLLHLRDPGAAGRLREWAIQYGRWRPNPWGGGDWYFSQTGLERLRRDISGWVLRRERADVLAELPELRQIMVPVVLSDAERQVYLQLLRDYTLQWGDGWEETIGSGGERWLRAHQLVSSWRLLGYEGPSAKVEVARELAEGMSGHTLWWVLYRDQAEELAKALGGWYIHGGVSDRERGLRLARWQTAGGHLVATYGTLGEGVHLAWCHQVVTVTRPMTAAALEQAISRCWRKGQDRGVVVWHLVAEGTIDLKVLRMLQEKAEVADTVVGAGDTMRVVREVLHGT